VFFIAVEGVVIYLLPLMAGHLALLLPILFFAAASFVILALGLICYNFYLDVNNSRLKAKAFN
jgi:hypothetical protein